MERYFFVKFLDNKHAQKVTYPEYVKLFEMAKYYDALLAVINHRRGRTLVVNFSKHFV